MKYLKYVPWVLALLAVGFLAFSQYQGKKATQALLQAKNEVLQQANLELGRAKTALVDQADLHKSQLDQLKAEWQKDIKQRNALLTLVAELEGKYEAEVKKHKITTRILWKERNGTKIVELPPGKLFRRDGDEYQEVNSLAFNYKDFRITISGDAIQQTLSYKLHQKFRGQFVETKLPTGAVNHYARIYELDDQDKIVNEIQLEKFEVLKAKEGAARMYWWNPKLDMNVGGAVTNHVAGRWLADIGVSIAGYGVTPDDLKWRFLRIGAGISNHSFSVSVAPAQYNIAKHLPVVSNIWLSPFVAVEPATTAVLFGLGLAVMF